MSDPRVNPGGPYDPQPQPVTPPGPTPASPPGHAPLEVPPVPATEPPGIPVIDPDRGPVPEPTAPPAPSPPTGPIARGMSMAATTDPIGDLLGRVRTIAMVGASPERHRPSFGIMRYLQAAGYRVIPINPHHAGETLHGETVLASLAEAGPVDLVNVFRRSEAIDAVVGEAIAARAPAIWTQLGISNDRALDRARQAGLEVVSQRCISVEHSRRR